MSTKVRGANESDPTMPDPRWRVFGDRDYEDGRLLCVSRDESVVLEAFKSPPPRNGWPIGVRPERTLLAPGDYVTEAEGGAA